MALTKQKRFQQKAGLSAEMKNGICFSNTTIMLV